MLEKMEALHLYRDESGTMVVSREPVLGCYTTTCVNLQELEDSPGLAEATYGDIVDGVKRKANWILAQRRALNKKK